MSTPGDLLENIHARLLLEEINHFVLHGAGSISEAPGKLSLVWDDPSGAGQRFVAIKASGDTEILVNGRRYPGTVDGLKSALRASLRENALR
jgi:hypothetical protein